jgi:RNA polymerase sigma factor (sigma-70 family)
MGVVLWSGRQRSKIDAGFDEFVRTRSEALLRTAWLLVGDRGHAEDLLQETFVRTARHWATAREAPNPYAPRVLINLARDRWRLLRRRPRETTIADDDPGATLADPTTGYAAHHDIVAGLKRLPHQQRTVVVLRVWEDLSVSETARLWASPKARSSRTWPAPSLTCAYCSNTKQRSRNAHR